MDSPVLLHRGRAVYRHGGWGKCALVVNSKIGSEVGCSSGSGAHGCGPGNSVNGA